MPVRLAGPGDLVALEGLLAEVYAAFDETPPAADDLRRWLDRVLTSPSALAFLVADGSGGALDGMVSVTACPTTRDASEFVYLDDLYVRPGARGHGMALELLEAARAWAAHRGATEIRLAADSSDEGLWNLYREAGYERQRMNWMILGVGRNWARRSR